MFLEVTDIVSGYGSLEVLHGVSIRVKKNEIVGIIGPNGAGKSTLMKTIFGFLRAKNGKVIMNGENITNLKPTEILKKGISYVLQGRSVFPKMTLLENLELGAFIRNDKEKIKDDVERILLDFPILEERKKQLAGTLSGGEQRILELARSMLLSPKIAILDEPSLGLAPKIKEQIFNEIQKMRDRDISILLIEQNARRALELSDYSYVLELGHNRFEGTGEEILHNEEVIKLFVGA